MQNPFYERKPPNRPDEGFKYEDRLRQFTMLTLKEGQALAVEMKAAGKFDDLVLSVDDGQGNFKYYLRQCKHKKDETKTINRKDLFDSQNTTFSLVSYFESFCSTISGNSLPFCDPSIHPKQTSVILADNVLIKELSIMTNIGFDGLVQSDFDEASTLTIWECLDLAAKRFKIKVQERNAFATKIKRILQKSSQPPHIKNYKNWTSFHTDALDLFLDLITFEVHQSNVDEMLDELKKQIKEKYFPFLNTEEGIDKAVALFQDGCQPLLDYARASSQPAQPSTPSAKSPAIIQANWITLGHTHKIVASIASTLLKTFSCELGPTQQYESTVLKPLLSNSAVEFFKCDQQSTANSSRAPADCCVAHEISSIVDMASMNGNRILNIVCDSKHSITPTLASCKLYAHFETTNNLGNVLLMKIEQKHELVCFTQFLERFDSAEPHKDAFLHQNPFFFIVEIAYCGDLKPELLEKLRPWTKINLILVSSTRLFRESDDAAALIKTTNDMPLKWGHLLPATQESLLGKTLKAEGGMQTSLKSLGLKAVNTDGDVTWLTSLALGQLILFDSDNDYLDLRLPRYNGEIDLPYIERRLKMPVINKSLLKDELKNILCFDRTEYETLKRTASSSGGQVHLLVPASTQSGYMNESMYMWSGESLNCSDLDELKQCVCPSREYEINEELLLNDRALLPASLNSKLAIVVDLPGMGKSTSLTHLCNRFLKRMEGSNTNTDNTDSKKTAVNTLILRVNLGSCGRQVWETASKEWSGSSDEKNKENEKRVIDFLFTNATAYAPLPNNNKANDLSRSIIEGVLTCSESHGAIVMLDGFDEISQNARELIENVVLERLREMPGAKRIVLASRPDGKIHESVELKFGQLAFHLTELSEQNQENLLVSFWTKKLMSADKRTIDHDACNKFARALVKRAREELDDEDRNFLDIPLQCMLFAECFYEKLEAHLDNSANKEKLDGQQQTDREVIYSFDKADFDVLSLYTQYFSKKCNLFMEFKAQIKTELADAALVGEDFNSDTYESVERLCVRHILRNPQAEQLFESSLSKWDKFKKDLRRAKRLGIVTNDIEHDAPRPSTWPEEPINVHFIHRTFAEYLFATFLMNCFAEVKTSKYTIFSALLDLEKEKSEYFFNNILMGNEYNGVRRFFSRILQKKVPNSTDGCPFAKETREQVTSEWCSLGNEVFNNTLASYLSSSKSEQPSNRILTSMSSISKISPTTIWWLLCCLKEHFVRKTSGHRSFVSVILDNVLAYLLDFHVAHKEKAKFESALRWFEHPLNVDTRISACLTEVLLNFVCQVVTQAANAEPSGSRVYYFGSLSAALMKHQATARLTCQDFSVIVERLFPNQHQQLVFTTLLIGHVDQVPDSVLMLDERNLLFEKERRLMSGETLRLLQETKPAGDLFSQFKSILELGCPALFAGDTSLFERQIGWFLSATRLFATRSPLPNADDARTRPINFLQLQCISYLLTWTYRTIVPQNSAKGDEYLKRIIRQAIRFDVRIPKWLKRVRFFESKSDEDDYETLALDRALEHLPLAHRAAIKGDFAPINGYLHSRNGGSLAQQQEALDAIFTWTPSLGAVMNNSNGAYVWENGEAYESDRIPPAFYLAAAFGHSAFCEAAIAVQQREMEAVELKTFFKECIQYALHCINDETFTLTFLDYMMNSINETDEFYDCFIGNGQLATGESPQVMALKKLTCHLWPKVTMKTVEKYGSDDRRRLFEAVFGCRQFAPMSCPWTLTRYADFFLEMFQCVSKTESRTFLAKLVSGKYPNAMYNILQGCHNYFKRKWLELPKSMEALIDEALWLIWDVHIGEEACLRFVFECFKDSEVCEYSWIAIVTEPFTKYFPKKLSNDGFRFLVDYITTQVGQGCLLEEALKSETHGSSVAFDAMVRRVFSTNGLGLGKVQQLLQMQTDCEKYIDARRNNDAMDYVAD